MSHSSQFWVGAKYMCDRVRARKPNKFDIASATDSHKCIAIKQVHSIIHKCIADTHTNILISHKQKHSLCAGTQA